MKKVFFYSLLIGAMSIGMNQSNAQCDSQAKAVKTSYYKPHNDLVDIAAESPDFSTLVAAVKAAGLVETLKGDGPFTIFAPTNAAFDALPDGTISSLLKPENKKQLTNILTYHVIAGNLDSKVVVQAIEAGNGKATVTSLNGGKLTAMIVNSKVRLKDENGNIAEVTKVDVKGDNGVIHIIDTVVLPK